MDWDKLRVFHAVAEVNSLTNAGVSLGLSQSAVSRQISSLEKSLNIKLFNRHARGLILTSEGEILYKTTRNIFSLLHTVQTKISDTKHAVKGTLKIATTTAVGTVWLPPRLNTFFSAHPDLNAQFILTDGEVDFTMREADLALRFGKSKNPPPGMIHQHLFNVNLKAYGAKSYFKKYGTPKTVDELSNHKLLIYGGGAAAPTDHVNMLLHLGAKLHEIREPFIQLPSAFGLLECARSGMGIALLADYIARDYDDLIPLFPDISHPVSEMIMVYPKELVGTKRIEAFLDFIRKEAAKLKVD